MWRTLMASGARSAPGGVIMISETLRIGCDFVTSATILSESFWWSTSAATTARYAFRSILLLTILAWYWSSTAAVTMSLARAMRNVPSSPWMTAVGVLAA